MKVQIAKLLDRFTCSSQSSSTSLAFPTSRKRRRSNISGQLMVELMVSMSLLVIGIMGILAVLSQSLSLNRVAANQYIGANLAAEGIEVTKNIIDANFINGRVWNYKINYVDVDFGVQYNSIVLDDFGTAGDFLLFDSDTGMYGYDSGTPTNFKRSINITNNDTTGDTLIDEIVVVSSVTWVDRGGIDFTIDVEDRFRNWRITP